MSGRGRGRGRGRRGSRGGSRGSSDTYVSLKNVPYKTKLEQLKEHIAATIATQHGRVDLIEKDGKPTGEAKIVFRVVDDAKAAAEALTGTDLEGRTLTAEAHFKKELTAQDLDDQMDAYMNKDQPAKKKAKKETTTAEALDAEMDAYRQQATAGDDAAAANADE